MQRVAKKYLTKENRSVVITMPKAAAPEGRPVMKRQAFVVALVAGARARRSAAQQPPPPGGANPTKAEGTVLKNKAPVSKEILRVTLPKPKEADLSNGVHLIVHRGSPRRRRSTSR